MRTIEQLKVGDTAYMVDTANGRGREPTKMVITKIGSKLITCSGYGTKVFRKDTLRENDQYCHWQLIIDLDDYIDAAKRRSLLRDLSCAVQRSEVSLADIRRAIEILKLNIPEPA